MAVIQHEIYTPGEIFQGRKRLRKSRDLTKNNILPQG